MSLLPLLFSNWWEDLDRPHRVLDQNFGTGVNPDTLFPRAMHHYDLLPREASLRCPMSHYRPWGDLQRKSVGGASTVKADKDQFRVDLDVQQFLPDEINVKVVDRSVIVEGRHEDKQDEHGWISRQFSRRYIVPEQCDIEQVASKLSSDGVLSIIVPRKQKCVQEGERLINIEHTGKPAVRDVEKEEKKSTEEITAE